MADEAAMCICSTKKELSAHEIDLTTVIVGFVNAATLAKEAGNSINAKCEAFHKSMSENKCKCARVE